MLHLFVEKEFVDLRLDKFLCQKFDISFGIAQKLIRSKKVKVLGAVLPASYRLALRDEVTIYGNVNARYEKQQKSISKQKIQWIKERIIFRDDKVIAIDKPSGLSTQGGSGITISLDDFLPYLKFDLEEKPQLVHRLDKDTSGVILIARTKEVAEVLTDKFRHKEIRKTYQAMVDGYVKKDFGVIDIPLKKKYVGKNEKVYRDEIEGKTAITKFKVLQRFKDYSLLELHPLTGRTHQIRVHCKELGYPIIGDVKYGGKKVERKEIADRLCLHAKRVVIDDFFGARLDIASQDVFNT